MVEIFTSAVIVGSIVNTFWNIILFFILIFG